MSSDGFSAPEEGDDLVFLMGEFKALFPRDRKYARNHMWAAKTDEVWRFGFSAYAVRLLQDVYFLDWIIDEGTRLSVGKQIGSIESKKAESDLFSPLDGELLRFNASLLSDPSTNNVDKFGAGWLFEMSGDDSPLMSREAYLEHLEQVWVVAQRTIIGQMNE